MDAVALNAVVEYAYRGTVTCDARRIVDALPVLASLQMMGMQRAEATVGGGSPGSVGGVACMPHGGSIPDGGAGRASDVVRGPELCGSG